MSQKHAAMGKTKKGIDKILKNDKAERLENDEMKDILGGRGKKKKFRLIRFSFRDIMPS